MSGLEARVLTLVGDVGGLLEIEEFRDGLFVALREAVACDYVSLNQVAPTPEDNWSIVDPPMPAYDHETFYRLALQNPLAERFLRTRDGRPLRLSDVATREAFHATDLYVEFYAPIGVEHQIAFSLPSDGEHILAIALSRHEPDFTDDERDVLGLARPHLIQAYRNVLQFSSTRDLGPETDATGPPARRSRRRSRSLMLAVVLGQVDRSLDDPDLSPAGVAERVGISTRYLHRLFADNGPSFSRWVLSRRLERCHDDLVDPALEQWTIAQIAHRHGFRDPSYMARAFRVRYGASPRQLRQPQPPAQRAALGRAG